MYGLTLSHHDALPIVVGRAYRDDGKPALASVAFYENYQKRPKGDRAADSLAYLGEALIQLKKPADACKVYAELEQVYGASLSNGLRGLMDKGRTRAKRSEEHTSEIPSLMRISYAVFCFTKQIHK